jgi:hypothetical protein
VKEDGLGLIMIIIIEGGEVLDTLTVANLVRPFSGSFGWATSAFYRHHDGIRCC